MTRRQCYSAACLLAALSAGSACTSTTSTSRLPAAPAIPQIAAATGKAPGAPSGGVKAAIERHVRAATEIRNAVDAGEGDLELRRLRESVVARPGDLEARLQLAARYEELDMPELAVEHYRLAAARFPGEAAPQIRLARTLHRLGRTADAAHELEGYLSAYGEAPAEAHAWAGIVRDALGHHHVAEQHHRAALERASGKAAWMQNNLGQNLSLQDRSGEAESAFRAALQLEPGNQVARNNLATLLAGRPDEAVRVLEAGTDDPATAHSNLAAILIEQGRYEGARKELNLALGYKPDHMAALRNLAVVSDLDGKPARIPLAQPRLTGQDRVSPGAGAPPPSALHKVGRALARIFTSSETRHPEQPVASQSNGGGNMKKKAKIRRAD